jgi:hypothetical protein
LISYSYFLAGKKRKKAGNFPAFFCEPFGYFWKIFWTIVDENIILLSEWLFSFIE